MTTSPVGAAQYGGQPDPAAPKIAQDFNTFLTILTTQLKNQDPLAPLDTNQFTQQLVQFTGVEQMMAMNAKLDTLIGAVGGGTLSGALSYLDRIVDAASDTVTLDGTATIGYALDAPAAAAEIRILDASGAVIRKLAAETGLGRHSLVWDGTDAAGKPAPNSTYKVELAASDAEGRAISGKTVASGRVVSVETRGGKAFLVLDSGVEVAADAVTRAS